ncbi:hypothetical protein J2Z62_000419 [Mycoplasmoides fastidiosum]|uniref:Lipoprotein n=1 Tax=Mycoplasmoides fastidiosum TaxID=92758 RepID=A0ABU0LZ50_9BACT|nr:hypothetical protein [Mycoplasmoides fastidiosum]MDQ0513981.1 hypothetical protein [Mycoplasmoides fastidiosum]UUD37605.1 hypothetical protein NPA10_03495 [Mycoplasmoides fastidiosum]
MKKLKFLHKNKLWLASLGLATTGILVLAACGSNVQPNQPKSDAAKPNTDDSSKKDESSNEPKQEDTKPKVPTATTQQLAVTKSLLSNDEIKTHLTNVVKQAYDLIKQNLEEVTEIGAFNRTKVNNSIYALDKNKNTAKKDGDTDVKELVEKLQTNLAASDSNVPENEKANFNAALKEVTDHAASLLTALEALPADNATNELTALKDAFVKVLDEYKTANAADAQTKLTALVTAKNNYQTKLSAVNSLLLTAERKAFALDRATSELEKYINTKVGTFLTEGNKSSEHSTNLNNLITKVRTNVLGAPGKDLWLENDAPADIATDKNKATSSQLYAMVASLAHQIASWNSLNNTFKVFTYNQGLLSELPSALNVLGLHIDVKAPLDVAWLNAYLVVDKANIVKLLNAGDANSIKKVLEKISVGISHYEEVLGKPEGQSNGMAKLVKDLTDLHAVATGNGKTKAAALKTEAETLVTNFEKFKTEWNKLEGFLFTGKDAAKVYPLLQIADNLNQAIAVSDSYGQVLEVVSQAKKLETLVDGINNNLVAKAGSASTVISTLKTLVDDITNTTTKFGKALADFAKETTWGTTAVTGRSETNTEQLASSIAREKTENSKKTYSGYVYLNGIVKSNPAATNAKFSLEDLQTELKKLTLKNTATPAANQTLGNVKDLLVQQLRPNIDSQTAALNKHLPEMFNNGDVLPETENHI